MNGLLTTPYSRSQPEKVAEAFFLGVLFVVAFLANCTICCAMLQPYRLKIPSNLFPFSLALANLSLAILHTPYTMAAVIMDQWPFDNAWCQISGMLINLVSMASNFSVVLIAVHRYYLIVKPLSATMSIRRARTMVLFIWFTAFVTAIPPLFGWNSYKYIPGKGSCSVDWQDGGPRLVYSIYVVIVSFLVPFGILVYIYRAIYLKTKLQRMKTDYNTLQGLGGRYLLDNASERNSQNCFQKLLCCLTRNSFQNSMSPPTTAERTSVSSPTTSISFSFESSVHRHENSPPNEEIKRRREAIKQTLTRQSSVYEQKTVQNAFILLSAFLITLAPYYIVGIWSGFAQQTPSSVLDFIVTWMFVSMTVVNPILYGFLNRQIRRVVFKSTIVQLVCQVCRCCNADLDTRFGRSTSGWGRKNDVTDSEC